MDHRSVSDALKRSSLSTVVATLQPEQLEKDVKIILEHLEFNGMVNQVNKHSGWTGLYTVTTQLFKFFPSNYKPCPLVQPLLNPVQTKREYFWLFLIVIIENAMALVVEVRSSIIFSLTV